MNGKEALLLKSAGGEMRPFADAMVEMEKQLKNPKLTKFAKQKLEKDHRHAQRQFVLRFNRTGTFEEFCWPDGLTVTYVGPSIRQLNITKDGNRQTHGPWSSVVKPVFKHKHSR